VTTPEILLARSLMMPSREEIDPVDRSRLRMASSIRCSSV
jgi:hypothetical protein